MGSLTDGIQVGYRTLKVGSLLLGPCLSTDEISFG
jgi:hypothetical protein